MALIHKLLDKLKKKEVVVQSQPKPPGSFPVHKIILMAGFTSVVLLAIAAAFIVPALESTPSQQEQYLVYVYGSPTPPLAITPQATITPIPTPRPQYNGTTWADNPHQAPTPTPTTAPVITPTPTPMPPRWCDPNGCYWGEQPTPTPEPTITPTPTPAPTPVPEWIVGNLLCETPTRLLGEPWIKQNEFQCACDIRSKFSLGPDFNIWDGCFNPNRPGWHDDSCACVDEVCKKYPKLC